MKWTNRQPKREYLVVTLGDRKPKVTATFFNAKYLKKILTKDASVMLSGEVGYFKGTMQLTHPAFLMLRRRAAREGLQVAGRRSPRRRDRSGEDLLAAFERDFFPIYPRQQEGAELGHLRLRAPGARRARPGRRAAAGIISAAAQSDRPKTRRCGRSTSRRTKPSATAPASAWRIDEAVGSAMGVGGAPVRRTRARPARRPRVKDDGLLAAMRRAAAVRIDRPGRATCSTCCRPKSPRPVR